MSKVDDKSSTNELSHALSEKESSSRLINTPSVMDVFSKRPIIAIVLSLALVLIGIRAFISIPVLQFPQISSASIQISTPYVGASAETIQGFITEPIERAASSVPGADYIDSNTTPGLSTVTLWLKLNENSSEALAELSARIDQIRFELPEGAEDPSIQVIRADRPFAAFYLTVDYDEQQADMSRLEVSDFLSRNVTPTMSAIPGIQRIALEGGRNPAMRIWLDPKKMAAYNIAANDVSAALQANNIIATFGRSENSQQRISILSDTNLKTVEEFENLVVREVDNVQILIKDIADVELGEEEGVLIGRMDERVMIYISVWPLPGANEIDIGDRLYEVIDDVNASLPKGCLLYTSPSPRDRTRARMPSSA